MHSTLIILYSSILYKISAKEKNNGVWAVENIILLISEIIEILKEKKKVNYNFYFAIDK